MATESLRQRDALLSMLGTTLGRRGSRHDPQKECGRPAAQVSEFSIFMKFEPSVNMMRLGCLRQALDALRHSN